MINAIYRLVAPRKFQIEYENIDIHEAEILIRPTYLSICHADQRYYQGLREPEVLEKKLPMALIHEAIGTIVYDRTGTFKMGERVVMIPNIPPFYDEVIGENYMLEAKFRSSGYDGFLQEYVVSCADRIIALPGNISNSVGAFLELVSVAMQAVNRFENNSHIRKDRIAVWGDGNLGYITSLLLKKRYPDSAVIVFGKNADKLVDFSFADETYCINEDLNCITVNHAFECVGGVGSEAAINQIIDLMEPEGTISLMGVSEHKVGINTRLLLEKGIRLVGNSRSGYCDFMQVIELLNSSPEVVEYLERLNTGIIRVSGLQELVEAFENDIKKTYGKTILEWLG